AEIDGIEIFQVVIRQKTRTISIPAVPAFEAIACHDPRVSVLIFIVDILAYESAHLIIHYKRIVVGDVEVKVEVLPPEDRIVLEPQMRIECQNRVLLGNIISYH